MFKLNLQYYWGYNINIIFSKDFGILEKEGKYANMVNKMIKSEFSMTV